MSPPFDRKNATCVNHPTSRASRRCYRCLSPICKPCQQRFMGHIFCSGKCRNLFWMGEKLEVLRGVGLRAFLRARRVEKAAERVTGSPVGKGVAVALLALLFFQAWSLRQASLEISRLRETPPPAPAAAPAPLQPFAFDLSLGRQGKELVLSGPASGFAVALLLVDGVETQSVPVREGRFSFTLGSRELEGRSAQVSVFGDGIPAVYSRSLPLKAPAKTAEARPPEPVAALKPSGERPAAKVPGEKPAPLPAAPVALPAAPAPPSAVPAPPPVAPEPSPSPEAAHLPAILPAPPEAPPSPPSGLRPPPADLARGPEAGRRLALTFDGGSSDSAAGPILDILAAKGVKGTFFLTGDFIRRYPDLTRRIVAEGHEVGNHTLDHPHLTTYERNRRQETLPGITRDRLQKELVRNAEVFREATGREMARLWRAPYGEQNEAIRRWAWEAGWRHVGWTYDPRTRLSLDTLDWVANPGSRLYLSSEQMVKKIFDFGERTGLGLSGGIVLLHLGNERRTDAVFPLGRLIDELASRGYAPGTVSALIGAEAVAARGEPGTKPVQ